MAWRDLAEQLDDVAVGTFDYVGVTFQKMDGDTLVGAPVPVRADYDGAYAELGAADAVEATTLKQVAGVHFADFPPGIMPEAGDRLIFADGPAAGTMAIVDVQANNDRTGALLILRRY